MVHKTLELLAVEDTADIRSLIVDWLTTPTDLQYHFSPIVVDSTAAALRKLDSGYRPKVVLSDYRLKGDTMSGLPFLERVVDYGPRIARILFTSDDNPELAKLARNAGISFLYKDAAKWRDLKKNIVRAIA